MKKTLLVLLMVLILTNATYAAAPNTTIDDLFPPIETLNVHTTQPKTFDKYSITHYMFDTEKFSLLESWATALNAITNVLFLFITFISYMINYLLMACFKFNIFQLISGIFNSLIWAVRDAVLIPLLGPLMAIVGITFIFNAAIGRFTTAWKIVMNTLIVLVLGGWFLANPAFFMDMINDMSEDISGKMLASTSSIATGSKLTADDAVVNLGNTFWSSTVTRPWQLIQFGSLKAGEGEMDKYLNLSASDQKRKEMATKAGETNELFKPAGAVIRFVMVLFIGVIVLILDLFVGALALLTVMLQFGAIICAIMVVITLILGLLPNNTFRVPAQMLYRTLGFQVGKIGMTLLLCVYFALNIAIYRLSDTYGWMITVLLQLMLIASIILFRKQILGFAYSAVGGQQQAIENVHRKRDTVKDLSRGAFALYGAKKVYDDVNFMMEKRQDEKLTKQYTPMAQEYLMQRYTNEKRTSEARARKEGTEVQYSDFVKTVESRVDKGFTAFDERDVERTVVMMKGLHKQGNKPENLLTTEIDGHSDRSIRFKQHNLEKSIEDEKQMLEARREENSEKIDGNIKADQDSKLYDKKVEKRVIIDAKDRATAEVIATNPEAAINTIHGVDGIVLSNKNISALGELRKERLERDYVELKKLEYEPSKVVDIQELEAAHVQEQKQVVNGNSSSLRPAGFKPIGSKHETTENRDEIHEKNIQQLYQAESHDRSEQTQVSNIKVAHRENIEDNKKEIAATENIKSTSANQENTSVRDSVIAKEMNQKTNHTENTVHSVANRFQAMEHKLEKVNNLSEKNTAARTDQVNTTENVVNNQVERNERNIQNDSVIQDVTNRSQAAENKLDKVNNVSEKSTTQRINQENVSENVVNSQVERNERVLHTETITNQNLNRTSNIENKVNKDILTEENKKVINTKNITERENTIINNAVQEKRIINIEEENINNKKIDKGNTIDNSKTVENITNRKTREDEKE